MSAVRARLAMCAIVCLLGCQNEPGLGDIATVTGTAGSAALPDLTVVGPSVQVAGVSAGVAGAPTAVAGMVAIAAAASGAGGVAGQVALAGRSGGGFESIGAAAGAGGNVGSRERPGGGGSAGDAADGGELAGAGGRAGMRSGEAGAAGAPESEPEPHFSFFVTSLGGMRELARDDRGFGGDLRFGEESGLAGADKICSELAERSLTGSGTRGWRAFLSAAHGGRDDGPIHARDRIGSGPWYDRTGRLVAKDLTGLLRTRPMDADPAIANDLPNERGEPNRTDTQPDMGDNHDVVTATNSQGLYDGGPTCDDWTSRRTPEEERGPRVGHSWPSENSGASWIQTHQAPGCAPSVSLSQMSGGGSGTGIGNGGGYGGIYCFALMP